MLETALPAATPYCSAATSAYLATATSPLPSEPPRTRSRTSTVESSAAPTETSPAGLKISDFFPACAVDCVEDVLYTATTCEEHDDICLCQHSNQYKIYAAAEQCVIDACGYDVAQRKCTVEVDASDWV